MSAWPWWRQLRTCTAYALVLSLVSCSGSGGNDPSIIADITLDTETVTLDATGQNLQLTATVVDENGDAISNAPVDWDSEDPSVVTVSESGLLVAQLPGTSTVTARAGEVSATLVVAVVSVSSLDLLEGNGQTASAGEAVTTPPAVQVRDAENDPVPNVRVRFESGTSSGVVSGETQLTDPNGIARVGAWRLGTAGVNTLSASVEGAEVENEPLQFIATTAAASGYDITLHYLGEYTTSQLLSFAQAELRWESHITGELQDVNFTVPANECGDNPEISGRFDDLTILVRIVPIDGPFGVLAQAGYCGIRVPSNLPFVGVMQFDSDDLEFLENEGSLQSVILHEMGHVIGFGTIWTQLDLLEDPSVPDAEPPLRDTHFTGAQAIAAFNEAGGTTYSGAKVPVMNIGGPGTVNSHWRDEVLNPEVMTGELNDGFNPLSAITIRSLQDLGYAVSVSGADPFTLSPGFRVGAPSGGRELVNDVLRLPVRGVDANGRVVVIRR